MATFTNFVVPAALPQVFTATTSQTVTVTTPSTNTERVWCGQVISGCVWPWFNTPVPINSGGTAITGVVAGSFYVYSPTEPATVTFTIN